MADYEIIQWEGKTARRYSNGVIRDEKGIIRHVPTHVARAMAKGQQDLSRMAAIEGMNEATGKKDFYESIRELIKKRTEMAMNDTTRAGNEALRMVLQHTGLGQERTNVTTFQGKVEHKVIPQFPKEYLRYLKDTEVVDGEAYDE